MASVHGLMKTKGSFQLRGIVTNTEKAEFYKEGSTPTGKPKRSVKFGVKYDKNSTANISLNGYVKKEVFFSKNENGKNIIERVPWEERFTFSKEGFRLIGVHCGVKKITNSNGELKNNKKILTEFDACKEFGENLHDDVSVFVSGKLDFGSFDETRYERFVPNQVSLCKDVDFSTEDFTPINYFTQRIMFMGISQEEKSGIKTGRFVVSAKIVTYSSIEDAEFIVENATIANTFRKALKPYNAIEVFGTISIHASTDIVDDDIWGAPNPMERVNSPTKKEFIITGAKKSSLDRDIYSKELVEEAMVKIKNAQTAKNDFGGTTTDSTGDDWGSPMVNLEGDDLDEVWQ